MGSIKNIHLYLNLYFSALKLPSSVLISNMVATL